MRVVGELAAIRELSEYPRAAASCLRALIPCDLAGYNALDVRSGRAVVAADPPDCVFDGGAEALARFVHQNPMFEHVTRTGAHHAMRLSDFIGLRALHRTELYNHVYRFIPQEYQLGLALSRPPGALGAGRQLIALTLGRTRRDFTSADVRLLDLAGPSFAATHERLQEIALLRAVIASDPNHATRWLMLVDHSAVVTWASPAAVEALGLTPGSPLPPPLRRWMAAARRGERGSRAASPTGMALTVAGLPVQTRLIADAYPGLDGLVLTPLTVRLTPRTLGLTRRQVEVLELALEGLSARLIAERLGLSRRTVEKHFEAIYARIGASNRAEAIVAALDAVQN